MKLLYDFLPIVLFFVAYKVYDIYVATAVAMIASVLQVSLFWLKHRRFERMHLISMGLIMVLGGLTLLLRDNRFIMWKPTIINGLFALVFAGSHFIGQKTLVERILSQQIELPGSVWTRLNLAWVGFFLFSGTANIYVAYHFSEATWVNFRLFGLMGITLVFLAAQAVYLSSYIIQQSPSDNESDQ